MVVIGTSKGKLGIYNCYLKLFAIITGTDLFRSFLTYRQKKRNCIKQYACVDINCDFENNNKRKQQRNTNPQDYFGFVYIAIQMFYF